MARFMISMPDEMLKKLDEAARREHRSRSELLREAARHRLEDQRAVAPPSNAYPSKMQEKTSRTAATSVARERMLRLGIGQSGCPGLDRLVGPGKVRPDMRRLLKIGKKLSGLSRDILESRKDRL